jgi:hypothetical protein
MVDRMSLLSFKNLNNTLFHQLSNDLVKAECPGATCVEGLGGDEGIDCFNGSSIDANNLHVFQHKFFTDTLTNSGKKQIKESLNRVARRALIIFISITSYINIIKCDKCGEIIEGSRIKLILMTQYHCYLKA